MTTTIPRLFDPRRHVRPMAASCMPLVALGQQYLLDSLNDIARPFTHVMTLGNLEVAREGTETVRACTAQAMTNNTALPFADDTADAFLCLGELHWMNDLPGALIQIRRMLKPDGMFLAVVPGAGSLRELRNVLVATEAELTGGATPRVAPMLDIRDAGALLQRAGFALPVVSSETFTLNYRTMTALMHDLRALNETSVLHGRPNHCAPRRVFAAAAERYARDYPSNDGGIIASVELLTLSGWKPAATQQQPARRGSGTVSLGDALSGS